MKSNSKAARKLSGPINAAVLQNCGGSGSVGIWHIDEASAPFLPRRIREKLQVSLERLGGWKLQVIETTGGSRDSSLSKDWSP
jgi:hypothetical protein